MMMMMMMVMVITRMGKADRSGDSSTMENSLLVQSDD